jgi:hypothetical protein
MHIKIDFCEASNLLNADISGELDKVKEDEWGEIDCILGKYTKDLSEYIIENYFNGAELAIKSGGFSWFEEEFEFEIMPN